MTQTQPTALRPAAKRCCGSGQTILIRLIDFPWCDVPVLAVTL
jgi:hypothetical protein